MAQTFDTNFSASPVRTTTPPFVAQSSSSMSSGPPIYTPQSRRNTGSPPIDATNSASSGPQPNPRSCITCRKRKVRCDKRHPCSNCTKADIECIFPGPGRAPRRSRKPPDAELLARLRRLEGVVQHLGKSVDEGEENGHQNVPNGASPSTDKLGETNVKPPGADKKIHVPSNCGMFNGPEPRKTSVDGVTKEFGRLVVEEGRSRYVSNKFWNSLGDEVSAFCLHFPSSVYGSESWTLCILCLFPIIAS